MALRLVYNTKINQVNEPNIVEQKNVQIINASTKINFQLNSKTHLINQYWASQDIYKKNKVITYGQAWKSTFPTVKYTDLNW